MYLSGLSLEIHIYLSSWGNLLLRSYLRFQATYPHIFGLVGKALACRVILAWFWPKGLIIRFLIVTYLVDSFESIKIHFHWFFQHNLIFFFQNLLSLNGRYPKNWIFDTFEILLQLSLKKIAIHFQMKPMKIFF
jgi:hypothetical protein